MSSGQEACQPFSASSYSDLIAQSGDFIPPRRWRRTAEEIAQDPAAGGEEEEVRLRRLCSLQI
jgi:hypothetical protein